MLRHYFRLHTHSGTQHTRRRRSLARLYPFSVQSKTTNDSTRRFHRIKRASIHIISHLFNCEQIFAFACHSQFSSSFCFGALGGVVCSSARGWDDARTRPAATGNPISQGEQYHNASSFTFIHFIATHIKRTTDTTDSDRHHDQNTHTGRAGGWTLCE